MLEERHLLRSGDDTTETGLSPAVQA